MAEGLELKLAVVGQGQGLEIVDDATKKVVALGQATGRTTKTTQTHREAVARAGDSLAQVRGQVTALGGELAGINPPLGQATQGIAGLATAANLLRSGLSGLAVVAAIDSAITLAKALWESYEARVAQAIERVKQAQQVEQNYLAVRERVQGFGLVNQKRAIELTAQVAAAQLRAGGQEIRALDEERKARLTILEIQEVQLKTELSKAAQGPEGKIRIERELAELEKRNAKERQAIEAEFDAKDRQFREAEIAREHERTLTVEDAMRARREAEAAATADTLDAQDRIVEAVKARLDAQLDAIRSAAERERLVWQEQLRLRQLDQVTFDNLLVEQNAATSARITSAIAKAGQARRQILTSGSSISLPAVDPAQVRADVADKLRLARAAEQALRGSGGPVGDARPLGPSGFGPILSGSGNLTLGVTSEDLARVDEFARAWWAARDAREAYNAAVAAEQEAANRPRLLNAIQAIDALAKESVEETEKLKLLEAAGVGVNDIFLEQQRSATALREKYFSLRQELEGHPAAMALVQQHLGALEFGGVATRVQVATDALAAQTRQARAVIQVFEDMPNSVGQAVGQTATSLDLLTGRLVTVVQWFGAAELAARRFANANAEDAE